MLQKINNNAVLLQHLIYRLQRNNMRKVFSFLFLLLPLCAFTQTISLGVSKDREWAVWTYETIEFRDDCTILKGFFVPSGNGCHVISNMDEKLIANGEEYRIIYTTLPIIRHPRTTYQGGIKVYFEEHFEPIFTTGDVIEFPSNDISFPVPFNHRKATKPYEDLYPAYEEHIDTLISHEKYDIAAYLLNQYVKKLRFSCPPKIKEKISKRILSKYRVLDFFLNASSNNGYIWSQFENTYYWLDFKEDDEILKKLSEISTLQNTIELNWNEDRLSDVIKMCESLMPMIQTFGKYNKKYEHSLCLYRKVLMMDRQTQLIPKLDKEIIDVCRHIYKTNSGQYIEHLMDIASDVPITSQKDNNELICVDLWKEIRDKTQLNFPESWRYAMASLKIADYNRHSGNIDDAMTQYLIIDSLCKVRRNDWIAEVWFNNDSLSPEASEKTVNLMQESLAKAIANYYYQKGDIESAIKHDENNPYYHAAHGDTATLLSWCKKSYEKSIDGLKSIIKDPVIIFPGTYYETEFDLFYTPVLTTHIPYFALQTKSVDLCEMAYNGVLITKEFRLNAGNRLRQYIKTTQDAVAIEYITRIDKEMRTYQSLMKTDVLKFVEKHQEILQLQRSLIAHLNSIGALEPYFPNWIDIRNTLKDDELAIEFIEFPLWNQNQSIYAALTLRKDSEHPKITKLFEEKDLKSVPDTLYYQCKEMTDLVWKPIQSELHGIKNIYFSPTAALHKIGIEYLPGMGNYNIYRLSSTRELVLGNETPTEKNAVLYGGLDYDAKWDSTSITKSHALIDEMIKKRANVRSMGLRGSKEPLPHTKVEVDTIAEYLKNAQWVCLLDTAELGTEESFKSLSGKKINTLHIATHGFYYTSEEADNIKYDFTPADNNIATDEDKALTRSGLIMSGGNHILERDSIPNNVEDGILTAKEIAHVDLRDLDLVVLSACQTGLGDLSQGEGVFGLQRGFKKAGANSILMSLWKVDDEATQILMTRFYKNFLSGQNKQQSLLSAQKYLKEYNKKYDNPKYWAAFILLDGVK